MNMKKSVFLIIGALIISLLWLLSNDNKSLVMKTADEKQVRQQGRSIAEVAVQDKKEKPSLKRFKHERKLDLKNMEKRIRKNREPSSIENYFHDDIILIESREFLVSQTLRTLGNNEYDERDGQKIANLSGYIFYESSDISRGQPALYNQRSKAPAVLTGRVILKNISKEQAIHLAGQLNVALDTTMAHLGVFAIVAPIDALETVRELGSSISSPEIIEGDIHEN